VSEVYRNVAQRLHDLGLSLSVLAADGSFIENVHPGCRLCEFLRAGEVDCEAKLVDLGRRALETNSPATCDLEETCCHALAVPVRQRRRAIGAAVACYATDALQDGEVLARLCDDLHLDRQLVSEAARRSARRGAAEGSDLLRMLEWVVEYEMAASVARDELTTLSTHLAATYEELSLLYRISSSMRVTHEPGDFLQAVCDQLVEVMNIEGAVAMVQAKSNGEDDTFVVSGCEVVDFEAVRSLCIRQLAPQFQKDPTPVVRNEGEADAATAAAGLRGYVAVPLANGHQTLGLVLVLNRLGDEFDSSDIKLVASINDQVSIFLTNNHLYAELQDLLMGVLYALTESIDAKDPYTCGHSRRVARISRLLAEESGFSDDHVQRVYLCGLLHDIGKIGVPESVLCKAGRLTDDEYETMKRHPMIGAKILGGIRQLDPVISGILTHHERLDGRGYPKGLEGQSVPIEGLIVGLADAFDAMTSDRTYRKALDLQAVIEEIRRHAGKQFEGGLVDILLNRDLEAYLREIREPGRSVNPVSLLEED